MNLLGLVGTKPIVVPRFCTCERMFFVVWRLRKWTCEKKLVLERVWLAFERPQVTIVSWEDLDQGLFKAEVKLGKRDPFVCVSCFSPKWHRKNTREHFQIRKTPIQQRQKFHERSGWQTSCLVQVCQRKSQKLTSKFHTFGNGCVAMLNHQRILYVCHNYGVYSPNMLNNGSVRSVSDQT